MGWIECYWKEQDIPVEEVKKNRINEGDEGIEWIETMYIHSIVL